MQASKVQSWALVLLFVVLGGGALMVGVSFADTQQDENNQAFLANLDSRCWARTDYNNPQYTLTKGVDVCEHARGLAAEPGFSRSDALASAGVAVTMYGNQASVDATYAVA